VRRTAICSLVFALLICVGPARASASPIFITTLAGDNEVPPTDSDATGSATVMLDGDILTVDISWADLEGGTAAAAHIHCCVPTGVNTVVAIPFTGFPATLSGSYSNTFDLTDPAVYGGDFLLNTGGTAAGAQAALVAGLAAHMAYTNIHNATFPGGEIRGQLSAVPEPTTLLLLGSGLCAAIARRRRTTTL
jgi:hypothetical protein